VRRGEGKYAAYELGPGHDRERWDNFDYARRMMGWYLRTVDPFLADFRAELVIPADRKRWDALRKRFPHGARYIRVWHRERGKQPFYHVFLAAEPPEYLGRQPVIVNTLDTPEEVKTGLQAVLVMEPRFPEGRRANKVTTNILELQYHSRRRREQDTSPKWIRSPGSARAHAGSWRRRGLDPDLNWEETYAEAILPHGQDKLPFDMSTPEPSGDPEIDADLEEDALRLIE